MWCPTSDMMTSSNGNIFRLTGHLCGEFTGHRWIPRTKASDAELWCFLWYAPWINGWVNTHEAGYLRRYRAHYDVIVMEIIGTTQRSRGMNTTSFSLVIIFSNTAVYTYIYFLHISYYRQTSSTRHIKSKPLNVSRFVLQLPLSNPDWNLVLGREWRCSWSSRQAISQLHLSDQQFYCLLRRRLY